MVSGETGSSSDFSLSAGERQKAEEKRRLELMKRSLPPFDLTATTADRIFSLRTTLPLWLFGGRTSTFLGPADIIVGQGRSSPEDIQNFETGEEGEEDGVDNDEAGDMMMMMTAGGGGGEDDDGDDDDATGKRSLSGVPFAEVVRRGPSTAMTDFEKTWESRL